MGKSTTAVNLAIALKNLGMRTGLLDADLQGPSVPRMLNLHKLDEMQSTTTGLLIPPQNYGIKAMSLGFLVSDNKSVVARGPMVSQQLQKLLNIVQWGELDVLCIDMPPGTHDVHLTITQSLSLDGAVIVTTPQEIAAMDTRRGMDMFRDVHVPMLGIVENMSHFICTKCDEKHYLFGEGGAAAAADEFGIPFLGSLPFQLANREGADEGVPIAHTYHDGPHAAPYYEIASRLIATLKENEANSIEILWED